MANSMFFSDKLNEIFRKKKRDLIFSKLPARYSDPKCVKRWTDYIKKLKGVEYIKPEETSMIDESSIGKLIKIINESPNKKFVISTAHNEFIVVEEELVEKILVLGNLP